MSDTQRRRQYDRSLELVQALRVLLLMPDEIRSIIGEGILSMIQQEFKEDMADKHYRSLGSHKILGLHKTKNLRRAYDANPILHHAIIRLYILKEQTQDLIGTHILAILGFIQRYLEDCTELQQELCLEDIVAITNRYIEKGSDDVEIFLKKLREEFYFKLHGCLERLQESFDDLSEDLKSNEEGMKINKPVFD